MADGAFKEMCSDEHRSLFLDLYIALLFKYKEKDVIITIVSIESSSTISSSALNGIFKEFAMEGSFFIVCHHSSLSVCVDGSCLLKPVDFFPI